MSEKVVILQRFTKVVKYYNNMSKYLIIGGEYISLSKLTRAEVKGAWLDAVSKYAFWKASIHEEDWFVLELKAGAEPYTPVQCARLSEKLQEANGCKVLFYFDSLDFNKRERLMAQNVFLSWEGSMSICREYLSTVVVRLRRRLKS